MGPKIICTSCGAEVEENLPKCPFCDTLLVQGAEQEYMDNLHRVRRDMESLKQVPRETVKSELKSQGRRIRRILMITGTVALLLAGLFAWENHKYDRDNKADYIWGQQNFPAMSELYENGEYETLQQLYYEALLDDKPVWNWEYYAEFSEWLEEQE